MKSPNNIRDTPQFDSSHPQMKLLLLGMGYTVALVVQIASVELPVA